MTKENVIPELEEASNLQTYKGKVEVTYVESRKFFIEKRELESIEPRKAITLKVPKETTDEIDLIHIPFLGNSVAIIEITDEENNILYKNQLVNKSYNKNNSANIRKKCGFGALS